MLSHQPVSLLTGRSYLPVGKVVWYGPKRKWARVALDALEEQPMIRRFHPAPATATLAALIGLLCAMPAQGQPADAPPAPPPADAGEGDEAPPPPAPKSPPKELPKFDPTNPVIDEETLAAMAEAEGGELTRDVLAETLAPVPQGLTPDDVAKRASDSSPSVAAARAEIRAAEARVDQAFAAYFPTVRLSASYTRVSQVDSLEINIPGVPTVSFAPILDQWALTAGVEVPISDYLLRLTQAYAAANDDVEARELETEARKLQASAEAKASYYNWVRAQGRVVVAALAVATAKRHVDDAKLTLAAGLISSADVLRLESQVAQAFHLVRASSGLEKVVAEQLRRSMHLEPSAPPLVIGIDVLADKPEGPKRSLDELKQLARQKRLDVKAIEKTKVALQSVVSIRRAGYYPRLDAFANGMYANPNPRVFPSSDQWDFTWDVGVRLSWTVNETFKTIGVAAEAEAQVAAVSEQLRALEDGIALSVTQGYYDIETARSGIEAAKVREDSAKKALDTRRRLLRGGKATATDIVDAETELTQAHLQRLDAHVDLLVAQTRLELAVGDRLF